MLRLYRFIPTVIKDCFLVFLPLSAASWLALSTFRSSSQTVLILSTVFAALLTFSYLYPTLKEVKQPCVYLSSTVMLFAFTSMKVHLNYFDYASLYFLLGLACGELLASGIIPRYFEGFHKKFDATGAGCLVQIFTAVIGFISYVVLVAILLVCLVGIGLFFVWLGSNGYLGHVMTGLALSVLNRTVGNVKKRESVGSAISPYIFTTACYFIMCCTIGNAWLTSFCLIFGFLLFDKGLLELNHAMCRRILTKLPSVVLTGILSSAVVVTLGCVVAKADSYFKTGQDLPSLLFLNVAVAIGALGLLPFFLQILFSLALIFADASAREKKARQVIRAYPNVLCQEHNLRGTLRSRGLFYVDLACRRGDDCSFIVDVCKVVGLIGAEHATSTHLFSQKTLLVPLWSHGGHNSAFADVDSLVINGDPLLDLDRATSEVLNRLKNDSSRPSSWLKKVSVILRNDPALSENTVNLIKREFKSISYEAQ